MDIFGILFKETFGFRPSRINGMYSHEQEVVESKLQQLAGYFKLYAGQQSQVFSTVPSKGRTLEETRENLQAHARVLKENKTMLGFTKRRFWRAHGLAKASGYSVLDRYTDYLIERR